MLFLILNQIDQQTAALGTDVVETVADIGFMIAFGIYHIVSGNHTHVIWNAKTEFSQRLRHRQKVILNDQG